MRAERLGSYSIETTVAGTPALSRLKSMARSLRLYPPPRCQMVMSPLLRRPPVRDLICVSGLCGLSVVSSSLVKVVIDRNDGVIGLYVLIGINQPSALSHCQKSKLPKIAEIGFLSSLNLDCSIQT